MNVILVIYILISGTWPFMGHKTATWQRLIWYKESKMRAIYSKNERDRDLLVQS